MIESTKPLSQIENFEDWESLVLAKGYVFVYFDGLNRFYIAPNHSELQLAFKSPPNIFDGFELSGLGSHPFYKRVELRAQQAETKAQQAENVIRDLLNSTSWRVTSPLRWVASQFYKFR